VDCGVKKNSTAPSKLGNAGETIALFQGMRSITLNICNAALFGAAVLATLTTTPLALRAEEHKNYHDSKHNDDHEWNEHENRAYRIWVKEHHRKYHDFHRLKEEERQSYWEWRHEHPDTVLKLDIR
jgi:hypothetical protein